MRAIAAAAAADATTAAAAAAAATAAAAAALGRHRSHSIIAPRAYKLRDTTDCRYRRTCAGSSAACPRRCALLC